MACTRYGDVELLAIDEPCAAHGVRIHYHAVHGGALGGVGGVAVAIIDVSELGEGYGQLALARAVELELGSITIEVNNDCELFIRDAAFLIRHPKLQPIANREHAIFLGVNLGGVCPFCRAHLEMLSLVSA